MRRRPGAKHCSSLYSQSEGGEYCGGQARAKNPTKSCPRALVMFATCSWLGCSKSRKISERFLTKWHGDIATRGASRTFGEGLGRSTVAHFARKVRGANIAAAKHELKIQRRYAPERWLYSLHVRGPHFASKVSYNAGAATDDDVGPQTSPLSQPLFFSLPQNTKNPATHMWGHGVAGLFMIVCQYARSVALATGRAAGCQSAMSENSAPEAKSWPFCSLTARKRM